MIFLNFYLYYLLLRGSPVRFDNKCTVLFIILATQLQLQMVGAGNGRTRRVEAEGRENGRKSSTTNQGRSAGPGSRKTVKATRVTATTQQQQKRHR